MTAPSSAVSPKSFRMGANLPRNAQPFQRHSQGLPFLRIAQELGYAKLKTARDNLRKPYKQVEITNQILRDSGHADLVMELMRGIDASTGPLEIPPLDEALHLAQLADMQEEIAEESFRDKLKRGEATAEDARKFIRESARARFRAEIAERAAAEWIKGQESR